MYRGVFTAFFAFLLMYQSMDRFGMIAFYELNKEYITEMFCVNKSRPALNCDGKCFLMQQLKEKDHQDDQVPLGSQDIKEIQLFPIQKPGATNTIYCLTGTITTMLLNSFINRCYINEVFHPPKYS